MGNRRQQRRRRDREATRLSDRAAVETPELELTTRAAPVRSNTINEEERSIEAVLATEAMVTVFDWERWQIIDEILVARGADLPDQVPLLESHNRFSLEMVVGSVRQMRVEDDTIVCRLFFAEGDERAERDWQKVRQGHVTDISAGYRVSEFTDIAPNTSKTVNGKRYTAGARTLRISTRWRVREGSLVPIGADEAAKIREENGHRRGKQPASPPTVQENVTMNERLREYLESIGLRSEATEQEAWAFAGRLTGEQQQRVNDLREADREQPEGETPPALPATGQRSAPAAPAPATNPPPAQTPPAETPDPDAIRAEAVRTERQRVSDIRGMAGEDIPGELVQRAVTEGWDTHRASREFLGALRGQRSDPVNGDAPGIIVRDRDRDCTERVIAAGLMHRAGVSVIDRNATERQRRQQEELAERGERYRHMSMLDVCREAIRLNNQRVPYNRDETIRAAVSTGALSNIFTTVVNAVILEAYQAAPDTTVGWVREVDVPDFKLNERIRLSKTAQPKRLPRGGTADHATRSDTKEQYAVYRYAQQFVVDEQDIIDDRFDALQTMPEEIGQATARIRPDLVYAILLANAALADNIALFEATYHTNYGTTSTALAAATLQAAIVAMAQQTQDGVTLNIAPRFLLVPQDLKFTAQILLRSAERVIAADSGGTYNPLRDEEIELRVDNRLGVAGVTDPASGTAYAGTATNWFLSGGGVNREIEVGYLVGTGRRPVLRSFVLDRGQWGIGWDVKFDIGAKALGYRGLYKATGAGAG